MKFVALLLAFCMALSSIAAHESPPIAPGSITPLEPITPSSGPRVDHGIDAFITGTFIYWTPRMDGLSYAMTGVGNSISNAGKGNAKHLDWDWNPGFKGSIGLNLPHDGWDVYAEYTWLHSSPSNSSDIGGSGMVPTWNISELESLSLTNESIFNAHAKWHLHFSSIDVSLGRNYFISQYLTLRPFVGFKGGWIDQEYSVRYIISTTDIDSRLEMKNDQDYWGIGLRAGLNTAWHIDPTWSLYGDLALSALWSQFETIRVDTRNDSRNPGGENPPLNTTINVLNTEDSFHTIKGVMELSVGLRGEWWFFENRYHILVQAGWEQQVWINHNNLVKTGFIQSGHGDFSMQGFEAKLRFDF